MLVLATGNKNKVREIAVLLEGVEWSIADENFAVEEGAICLMANALLKAQKARAFCAPQDLTLGEDTGLFVDALKGVPGVLSSRYAGERASFKDNIQKLLKNLEGVHDGRRSASFITACACLFPDGKIVFSCGRLDGQIALEPSGGGGFGYDPIFFVSGVGQTLADISFEEKTKMSHRYKAIQAVLPYIRMNEGGHRS